jgi:hypothetical protein
MKRNKNYYYFRIFVKKVGTYKLQCSIFKIPEKVKVK